MLLIEEPIIKLKVYGNLNPATLPRKKNSCNHELFPNFTITPKLYRSYRFNGYPMNNSVPEIFTDGGFFVQDRNGKWTHLYTDGWTVSKQVSLRDECSAIGLVNLTESRISKRQ